MRKIYIFLLFALLTLKVFSQSSKQDTLVSCPARFLDLTIYGPYWPLAVTAVIKPIKILFSGNHLLHFNTEKLTIRKRKSKKTQVIRIANITKLEIAPCISKKRKTLYVETDSLITNFYNVKTPLRYAITLSNENLILLKINIAKTIAPEVKKGPLRHLLFL